jgi:hypothetical protein
LKKVAVTDVMVRLGETIQPMKESFIVAHLAWSGAKEEHMVVPKEIQEYREKHGITWKLPENESTTSTAKNLSAQQQQVAPVATARVQAYVPASIVPADSTSNGVPLSDCVIK